MSKNHHIPQICNVHRLSILCYNIFKHFLHIREVIIKQPVTCFTKSFFHSTGPSVLIFPPRAQVSLLCFTLFLNVFCLIVLVYHSHLFLVACCVSECLSGYVIVMPSQSMRRKVSDCMFLNLYESSFMSVCILCVPVVYRIK